MKTLFLDPGFGRIWEQTCPDLTETHQKSEGKNALPNSQPLPSQSQAEGDLGGEMENRNNASQTFITSYLRIK